MVNYLTTHGNQRKASGLHKQSTSNVQSGNNNGLLSKGAVADWRKCICVCVCVRVCAPKNVCRYYVLRNYVN
jgi:hypothetical protein